MGYYYVTKPTDFKIYMADAKKYMGNKVFIQFLVAINAKPFKIFVTKLETVNPYR